MKEQSVKSSPGKFRCERPWTHEMGVKGSLATTLPSNLKRKNWYFSVFIGACNCCITYMELNIPRSAVKAKPMASIDFIFTRDKSRLLFFSFSSSLSTFFLYCLSRASEWLSLIFSTILLSKLLHSKINIEVIIHQECLVLTFLTLSINLGFQLLILFSFVDQEPGNA